MVKFQWRSSSGSDAGVFIIAATIKWWMIGRTFLPNTNRQLQRFQPFPFAVLLHISVTSSDNNGSKGLNKQIWSTRPRTSTQQKNQSCSLVNEWHLFSKRLANVPLGDRISTKRRRNRYFCNDWIGCAKTIPEKWSGLLVVFQLNFSDIHCSSVKNKYSFQ